MPRIVIYPQQNPFDPAARWRAIRHRGVFRYVLTTTLCAGYSIFAIVWAIFYGACRLLGSTRIARLTLRENLVSMILFVPIAVGLIVFDAWRSARNANRANARQQTNAPPSPAPKTAP